MVYTLRMIEIIQSETFKSWLSKLKDQRAIARIQMRLDRLALGNPGDIKPMREGLSEMCIDYGPGYRVYFPLVVILLAGGDKRTQDADIERAVAIAKEWSD